MKKYIILLLLVLFNFSYAERYVKGYYRKNGTYVKGYKSMSPYESKRTGCHYKNNVKYCSY